MIILFTVDAVEDVKETMDGGTTAFCLRLPGRTLFLSHLLALKKFRKRGNKDGALKSFYKLQEEGLGMVLEVAGARGSLAVSIISVKHACAGYYHISLYLHIAAHPQAQPVTSRGLHFMLPHSTRRHDTVV